MADRAADTDHGRPGNEHPSGWLLTAAERGNRPLATPAAAPAGGPDATSGNAVTPLVHGASYFARLADALRGCAAGDRVYFVDWRGDPDELMVGPGSAVAVELSRAASAGALVRGLIWRSHLDRFRFSEAENRNLAEGLQAVGAHVLLDQRVLRGGSHHQKFVVVRHRDAPETDVAFVGGIDLGHSRRDDATHLGDPQSQRMAAVYGRTPPWHDAQVELRGPVVADVEACFRERWEDPSPLAHHRPWDAVLDRLRGLDLPAGHLPPLLPPPPAAGPDVVQLLRTYPRRRPRYPFAPDGEHSVARAYAKAVGRARRLIYVEDQFLWSAPVAAVFAAALRRNPDLRMVAVVPRYPDGDGRLEVRVKNRMHRRALLSLREAGGDRVCIYDIQNDAGTPIYVHAKICVVDDRWASVGSANLNRRSWSHDSELAVAVVADDAGSGFPARLRQALMVEHLDGCPGPAPRTPEEAVHAFAAAAGALDAWYDRGRVGPRPPGRLRRHPVPPDCGAEWPLLDVLAEAVYDPDGRSLAERRAGRW